MATVTDNPREPVTFATGEGSFDLVVHISDSARAQDKERNQRICDGIEAAFSSIRILIVSHSSAELDGESNCTSVSGQCRFIIISTDNLTTGIPQVRSSQEYKSALNLSQSVGAKATVLLASDDELLSSGTLSALAKAILTDKLDLAVSAYQTSIFEGMVNSGILYPVSRVISGSSIRYPLAPDIAISANARSFLLQQRLQKVADQGQAQIFWPALDLVLAGFETGQVPVGRRSQPAVGNVSVGDLLTDIVGSLFTEVELKASSWQRHLNKGNAASLKLSPDGSDITAPDPLPLVESFKLGSRNLQEIWRLVLPPHSLLALKRLAQLPAPDFQMPDALWARIVYDFLLAHRSRTLSRKHLLGALTPLYLGWVASYVMEMSRFAKPDMDERVEKLAVAFEADRPYLVSQWRWPDRFNP